MLFDNSVHDLCIFWTDGQEAGRQEGARQARGTVPAMACHTQQSPGVAKGLSKVPLAQGQAGHWCPWGNGSHLCFHLVFNSSLLNFTFSHEFSFCPCFFAASWEQGVRVAVPSCQGSSKVLGAPAG